MIRALCRYAVSEVSVETLDQSFSFGAITRQAKDLAEEIEADLDQESITSRRVGRVLSKMRLQQVRTARTRGWRITVADLLAWLAAYGIELPDEFAELQTAPLSINGTNGTTAQPEPAAEPEREVFYL